MPLLLLDEPFGALDAKVRRELRAWLRELHDRTGYTTVFVTHDESEALELADRVVTMENGRIAETAGQGAQSLAGVRTHARAVAVAHAGAAAVQLLADAC